MHKHTDGQLAVQLCSLLTFWSGNTRSTIGSKKKIIEFVKHLHQKVTHKSVCDSHRKVKGNDIVNSANSAFIIFVWFVYSGKVSVWVVFDSLSVHGDSCGSQWVLSLLCSYKPESSKVR